MGIYITGDFHGDPYRLGKGSFYEQKEFISNNKSANTIIQLGDFGLIWNNKSTREEEYNLKWLGEKNFTTAFVDGNHDNIPKIETFPIKEWNGGLVNEILPNVLRLRRGEVYTIEGKKFFAFGGASSHDIQDGIIDGNDPNWKQNAINMQRRGQYMFRVKGISWWEEELPSKEEMDNGIKNLDRHNWKVDYIITHSPPASVVSSLSFGTWKQDRLTVYLEEIRQKLTFNKHFIGHMHMNEHLTDKDIVLYEQILRIH